MRPMKSRAPPAKIHMNDHLLPSGPAGARNAFRDGAPQCVAVVCRSFMPRSIHRLTASTLEADPNGGNTTEGHAASPDLRLNDIALVLSCRLPTAPGGARPPRPVRRPRDAAGGLLSWRMRRAAASGAPVTRRGAGPTSTRPSRRRRRPAAGRGRRGPRVSRCRRRPCPGRARFRPGRGPGRSGTAGTAPG